MNNRALLRLLIGAVLLVLVACLIIVTPLGYWIVRGIATLPGIAWAREQMASAPSPAKTEGIKSPAGGSSTVDAILEAGQKLQEQGLTEEALSRYREALDRDRNYLPTHVYLADLYAKTGRTKEAAQELEEAAKLAPDNLAIHAQLGNLYYELNEHDAAVTALERAKEIDPKDPNVRHLLGLSYFYRSRDDAEKAVAEMDEVAKMTPEDADVQYHVAMAHIARDGDGDAEKAIQALEKAIRLDSTKIEAYLPLGRLYLESGRAAAAIDAWEQYVARSDDAETVKQVREMIQNVRQMSAGQ